MKVLVLNSSYQGGGAERSARELAKALQEHGVATEFMVGRRDKGYPPDVRGVRFPGEKYLRAIRWLNFDVDWRHLGSRFEFGRIKAGDFDLVHLHNLFGGWTSLEAIRKLAQRIPLIWTFHDENPITLTGSYDLSRVMDPAEIDRRFGQYGVFYSAHPASVKLTRLNAKHLPQPAAIICPSQWLVNLTLQSDRYPGVPVHRVPYGVTFTEVPETREPRAEARRALGVPADAKIVLVIAAHLSSVYKGFGFAVEAVQKLKAPNVHLVLAGNSPDAASDRLAGISKTVLGYVTSDAKLAQMYRAADVTLMPSTADNLPYVALESFACETPVVAFAVGGFPELISNNERGALVPPFDTDALAAAVDRLLLNPDDRARCGVQARQWVLQECDMSKWIEKHRSIYSEVIQRFNTAESSTKENRT